MELSYLKYILPLSLFAIILLFLGTFFLGPKSIPNRAQETVTTWIYAKKNNDFATLRKIYDVNTIIEIEKIYADGRPAHTLQIRASKLSKLGARKNIDYTDTTYEWVNDGNNIIASSIKHNLSTNQKTPHTLILAPNRAKRWFIIEEFDAEYIKN